MVVTKKRRQNYACQRKWRKSYEQLLRWTNYNRLHQVDQLLSTISYQVDQPPMQIKSDHSDDDHVGIRNGSPESLKGLVLFMPMVIMITPSCRMMRGCTEKSVRCKKLVHLMSLLDIVKPWILWLKESSENFLIENPSAESALFKWVFAQGGRSCAKARRAFAEKFGLGRKV